MAKYAQHGITSEDVVDAWYIDTDLRVPNCPEWHLNRIGMPPDLLGNSQMVDQRLTENHTGPLPSGLTVKEKLIMRRSYTTPEGKRMETVATSDVVVEISNGPLDPGLFRVPHGFKKVKHLYRH